MKWKSRYLSCAERPLVSGATWEPGQEVQTPGGQPVPERLTEKAGLGRRNVRNPAERHRYGAVMSHPGRCERVAALGYGCYVLGPTPFREKKKKEEFCSKGQGSTGRLLRHARWAGFNFLVRTKSEKSQVKTHDRGGKHKENHRHSR